MGCLEPTDFFNGVFPKKKARLILLPFGEPVQHLFEAVDFHALYG